MWKQEKLETQIQAVELVKDKVVVSGGLAWHFMSPPHTETKLIHDHKDVDLFVAPKDTGKVIAKLKEAGFIRSWSKYDGSPGFYRYGQSIERKGKHVKVIIDLFVEKVPFIEVQGFKIVEPKKLLGYYKGPLQSSKCTAVKAASILVLRGINPVGRAELIGKTEPKRKRP